MTEVLNSGLDNDGQQTAILADQVDRDLEKLFKSEQLEQLQQALKGVDRQLNDYFYAMRSSGLYYDVRFGDRKSETTVMGCCSMDRDDIIETIRFTDIFDQSYKNGKLTKVKIDIYKPQEIDEPKETSAEQPWSSLYEKIVVILNYRMVEVENGLAYVRTFQIFGYTTPHNNKETPVCIVSDPSQVLMILQNLEYKLLCRVCERSDGEGRDTDAEDHKFKELIRQEYPAVSYRDYR